MSTDKDYTNVLLEEMNGKFDLLIEMMQPMKRMQEDVYATKEALSEVKSDVKIIKAAVTDLSSQVNKHEERISTLETA